MFLLFEITVIPRVDTHGVWIALKKPLDRIPYHPGYNNDPSKGLFCGVWLLPCSRDEANFTLNQVFKPHKIKVWNFHFGLLVTTNLAGWSTTKLPRKPLFVKWRCWNRRWLAARLPSRGSSFRKPPCRMSGGGASPSTWLIIFIFF